MVVDFLLKENFGKVDSARLKALAFRTKHLLPLPSLGNDEQ